MSGRWCHFNCCCALRALRPLAKLTGFDDCCHSPARRTVLPTLCVMRVLPGSVFIPCLLLLASACSESESTRAASAQVTETVTIGPTSTPTVTATATATVTATATATVKATVTEQVTLPPVSPQDMTTAYLAHATTVGMPKRQSSLVVQAVLEGGDGLNVLTSMPRDWGGWACEWEPTNLGGFDVAFSRILYQDGTVFRLCH